MSIEKYFEREYNYLQIAGEEFAEKHQTIAGMLRLSERQRKDPFVERLLEAFAFLSARVHERLDDEIPEFTGGLLEQLFPQFLRPVPSFCILQADIMTGAHTTPVQIPSGSEMQTPAGRYRVKYRVSAGPEEHTRTIEKEEPAEFVFRTTDDLTVRPMRLKEVRVEDLPTGGSALILRIQPDRNVTFADLELDKLRIHLGGSAIMKSTLLYYFLNYVQDIGVQELNVETAEFTKIHNWNIEIPGLVGEMDGALLPYSKEQFHGFRLLHEYFSFPQKFHFLDFSGLDSYDASDEGAPFEVHIAFERKLPREFWPSEKEILLHCVPIVNLFDRPVEEVSVTQRMPEYYIIPDLNRRKSREIYSVNSVIGVDENRVEQYHYIPVTSYDILDTNDPEYEYKRFYSITRRENNSDMADSYIRLFGPSLDQENFPRETLSIEGTLSNGFLPAKYLEVESITEPIDIPAGVAVKNITAPTDVLPYPERQNYLWALISHLSLNYQSLANTDNLKTLLSLYNWSPTYNNPNKKRIESITNVRHPETRNIYRKRGFIRGIEFTIELEGHEFEQGEGDIYLFGMILNRFFSEYVTFNSHVLLKILNIDNNKEYRWEPNQGKVLPV